jgi:uncharacterized protein involved in exopolysaccharide biosynthesis
MVRLISLRLLESYFRHRWLYLLPILLMAIAAVIYYLTLKPVYIVRGVLYVQKDSLLSELTSLNTESFSIYTPAEATTQEFNELLQTDAFVRAIIQQTDLEQTLGTGDMSVAETIKEVRKQVWVEAQGNNQVMIGGAYEDPVIAYQLSNAAVESFIQWRINAERQQSVSAQAFFAGLIETYRTDLDNARAELEQYLAAHPEQLRGKRPEIEQLEIDRMRGTIDLARARYASVLDKDESARLSMAQAESDTRQSYFLIDAPAIPTAPETSLRKTAVNMVIFVVAGVMLSIVAIIGGMLLDRSFRLPVDVQYGLGLPVLALLPESGPDAVLPRPARRGQVGAEPDELIGRFKHALDDLDKPEVGSLPA